MKTMHDYWLQQNAESKKNHRLTFTHLTYKYHLVRYPIEIMKPSTSDPTRPVLWFIFASRTDATDF